MAPGGSRIAAPPSPPRSPPGTASSSTSRPARWRGDGLPRLRARPAGRRQGPLAAGAPPSWRGSGSTVRTRPFRACRDPRTDRRPGAAADRGEVAGPARRPRSAEPWRRARRLYGAGRRDVVQSRGRRLVRAPCAARGCAGWSSPSRARGCAAGSSGGLPCGGRGRISSPTTFAICPRASPTRSARAGHARADLDGAHAGGPGAGGRACQPDHLRATPRDERRAGHRAARRRRRRVRAEDWDRCAGTDDPFLSHAFLSALEEFGKRDRAHRLAAAADRDRRRPTAGPRH